jgi:hypothetical protein
MCALIISDHGVELTVRVVLTHASDAGFIVKHQHGLLLVVVDREVHAAIRAITQT